MSITAENLYELIYDVLNAAYEGKKDNDYNITTYMEPSELSQMINARLNEYNVDYEIEFNQEDITKIRNYNFRVEKISELVCNIYSRLEEDEKEIFLIDCVNNDDGNLFRQFFSWIDDDEKKMECFKENLSDSQRLWMLHNVSNPRNFLDVINTMEDNYFLRIVIGDLKRKGLIASSDVVEIISSRENVDINDKLGIYKAAFSDEEIIEYLKTKPAHIDCLGAILTLDEVKDVLSEIDDDVYKAKIVLSCNYRRQDNVVDTLPYIEDEYLRTLVLYKVIYENREKYEIDVGVNVEAYSDFLKQEVFTSGTEEDQTEAIIVETENEVKKGMLSRIKSKENREKIIQSMTRSVDDDLEEMVLLSEKMIKDFFESHGGLTEDMQERMEIIFRSVNVNYTDEFRGTSTYGQADHLFKCMKISDEIANKPMRVLQGIIHEYAHFFSCDEFRRNGYIANLTYEEGIADLFSDMVMNAYFSKYPTIMLNNQEITQTVPYVIDTGYKSYNGWTRTMLYPLSKEGEDIEAIRQFLLGDKNLFFDMTLGENFSERYTKDYMGNPIINHNDRATCLEIYEANQVAFHDIDKDSIYYRQNFMLPAFVVQEKVENLGEQNIAEVFDEGLSFNHVFINNTYFGGRKLFEVSRKRV